MLEFLPELADSIETVRDCSIKTFNAPIEELPYTQPSGPNLPSHVSLCYRGTPEDAICVAHEFGHALQYHLTKEQFVPPIMREVAAFITEKALLQYCQSKELDLYEALLSAWQNDNRIYLGDDANSLKDVLASPQSPYTYRMNYPIARLLAQFAFNFGTINDMGNLFRGNKTTRQLIDAIQTKIGHPNMNNYLPKVPEPDKNLPAINAYRRLGMMALLDIDYWEGESEKIIAEYYSSRLTHMRNQTMIVAIGDERKPIGYALWEADDDDPRKISIQRQAAPFGDHLELQQKLQTNLVGITQVVSHHARSARQEQLAW